MQQPPVRTSETSIFPLAILPSILDALEASATIGDERWCTSTLGNLRNWSLVHRTWTVLCQQRLNHHIKLHPCKRDRHYELTPISQLGTEHLGRSTRSFALVCSCFTARCACEGTYARLLAAAPNLRCLLLSRIAQRSPNYLRLLGVLDVIRTLTQLWYLEMNVRYDEHMPQLLEVINALPKLESLSLHVHMTTQERPDLIARIAPRRAPLTSLSLHTSDRHRGLPTVLLGWLLRPESATITRISDLKIKSDGTMSSRDLQRGLSGWSEWLGDLRRMKAVGSLWSAQRADHAMRGMFPAFTALQSLYIDVDPGSTAEYRRFYEGLVYCLPQTLRWLVLNVTTLASVEAEMPRPRKQYLWPLAIQELDKVLAQALTANYFPYLGRLDLVLPVFKGESDLEMREVVSNIIRRSATHGFELRLHRQATAISEDWIF